MTAPGWRWWSGTESSFEVMLHLLLAELVLWLLPGHANAARVRR